MRCSVSALALVAVLALSAAAHADPDTRVRPLQAEDRRGMILAGDAAAGLFIGGGSAILYAYWDSKSEEWMSPAVILMGLGMYTTWAPATYWTTGARGRAVASGALRLALPLGGLAAAQAADQDTTTTLLAVGGGMVTAMAIDWLFLSRPPGKRRTPPPVSLYAAPIDGGAIAGVTGAL